MAVRTSPAPVTATREDTVLTQLLRLFGRRNRQQPPLDQCGPATIYRPGGAAEQCANAQRNQPVARYRECAEMRASYRGQQ